MDYHMLYGMVLFLTSCNTCPPDGENHRLWRLHSHAYGVCSFFVSFSFQWHSRSDFNLELVRPASV